MKAYIDNIEHNIVISIKVKPRGEGGALGSELNVALLHDLISLWFPCCAAAVMSNTDT